MPLVDRKTLLAGCLDDLPAGGAIRYSEHIETDGQAVRQKKVELLGCTSDGLLRHAYYKGLREDKDPSEVVRETRPRGGEPQERRQALELTHPDRLLWPDVGLTKHGLAEFYADIADWVLPHLIGRPLSLVLCPSGTASKCFFQKHAWEGMAGSVKRRDIGDDEVLYLEDLDGLIALVQASVLEIHPWGSPHVRNRSCGRLRS